MEWLNEVFGEGVDLAAIASAAGLGGGASSAAVALMFRGVLLRFFMRTLLTAGFTGVGFLLLLNYLGFQIVPRDDLAEGQRPPFVSGQLASPESVGEPPAEVEEANGKKIIYMKSPWRKHGKRS